MVRPGDGDGGEPFSVSVPAAQNNHSARDYYQQLLDAGAFSVEGTGFAEYACFSDDPQSDTFFTFTTVAYDEDYVKAGDIMEKGPDSDEFLRQYGIQQAIRQKMPYLDFIVNSDVLKRVYSPDAQQFFRRGGRILEEALYEKGVKANTLQYQWDGSSWFVPIPPVDPNAYVRTSKILHLSIEPTTMRYIDSATVTITAGSGDTAATDTTQYGPWAGVCEKVPNPK